MKDFISKLTIYDILSMVIPGGTILLCIVVSLHNDVFQKGCKIDSYILWISASVLSYLIGIVNHSITAILWSKFRNCPQMLQVASDETGKDKCCFEIFIACLSPFMIILLLFTAFYIVKDCISLKQINFCYIILPFLIFSCVFLVRSLCNININCDNIDTNIKDDYYQKYYYVATHTYRNDIFTIEGQVALMQNMFFPIFYLLMLPHDILNSILAINKDQVCLLKLSLLFLLVLLLPTIFHRQMKIYRCIYEDWKYLYKMEQEEKKSKNVVKESKND